MDSRPPRRGRFVVAFWLLFGAISGLQIQLSMLAHHHAWVLVLGYQVLVWAVWIAWSHVIAAFVRRVPLVPPRPLPILLHLGVALAFATLHAMFWVGVELWLRPYDFMNPVAFLPRFEEIAFVQVPLELVLYALVALAWNADALAARERERERQAAQLEKSLSEARLHALELQLQPHFLFNTLNGIASLIRAGQQAQAIEMMGGLSDLLRYSLEHAGGTRVTLEAEAGMAGRYLDIQRLRFADRLTTELDVAPEARRAQVPVLLLQPLAENAIQHGIAASSASGRVTIHARREGDELRIEVRNTGRLNGARRDGVGLSTTISRLAQMYGEGARFELVEEPGGVIARVAIPWSVA